MDEKSSNPYDLGLESFEQIKPIQETESGILFTVKTKDYPICPHCKKVTFIWRLKMRYRCIVDRPINNKPVKISVQRQTYKCVDCLKYFTPPVPHMDPKRWMTERAADYILNQVHHVPSQELADRLGINKETLRVLCRDHMAKEEFEGLMHQKQAEARRNRGKNKAKRKGDK